MGLLLLRKRNAPTLDFSFLSGLPATATFSRASTGYRFNASGVLDSVAADAPRFDYDPMTLQPLGLLIEEQRTNGIRNSALAGAVTGTPGTLPTNWIRSNGGGGSSLTQTVAGTGTEYGMPYVDIQLQGTASASGYVQYITESYAQNAAAQNDVWTNSTYLRLVGGSLSNISAIGVGMYENSSVPAYLSGGYGTMSIVDSSLRRGVYTRTLPNAATAYVAPTLQLLIGTGVIDLTLRLYQPQLEKGSFATSPIVTSGSAATRSADSLKFVSTRWFGTRSGSAVIELIRQGQPPASSSPWLFCLNDSTSSNEVGLYASPLSDAAKYKMKSGGADQFDIDTASLATAGSMTRAGLSFSSAKFASAVNGVSGTTLSTSKTLPATLTNAFLMQEYAGQALCSGWLRRFRYWNTALDENTLRLATT